MDEDKKCSTLHCHLLELRRYQSSSESSRSSFCLRRRLLRFAAAFASASAFAGFSAAFSAAAFSAAAFSAAAFSAAAFSAAAFLAAAFLPLPSLPPSQLLPSQPLLSQRRRLLSCCLLSCCLLSCCLLSRCLLSRCLLSCCLQPLPSRCLLCFSAGISTEVMTVRILHRWWGRRFHMAAACCSFIALKRSMRS